MRPLPGLRRKALLATLALHNGQVVSADQLIEIIWDGRPPTTAPNTLQRHVSYLRAELGEEAAIASRPHGYVLEMPVEATDVEGAERLIREGSSASDLTHAGNCLRAALALWRGRPLADISSLSWMHEQAERLTQVELVARQALVDARLALGEHALLVPELEHLAQLQPYHEQIHRQLIIALYRSGRQADALAAYRRLRATLTHDLGIDPSPALRDLEAAVLRQDAALDPQPVPVELSTGPAHRLAPAQLPAAVRGFSGRCRETSQLDALLNTSRHEPAPVVIAAVSGTAGVGKTAFAVHWAHRAACHFPDGQLYVNLRGFDADGAVVSPARVIRGFLDALGTPAQQIPVDVDEQASLYRTILAGKRVLVVLDNASDVQQVLPLLPASPGCLVLITSRNQLTPLVASAGAHPLTLDLLTMEESRNLLIGRLGKNRIDAEPSAVDDIIARCSGLPLALAVVAARAASQPTFPLAALAAALSDATDSLNPFHCTDPATDMRAVFSWSYRRLTAATARLFRLLGLHPAPDISARAAASLAGLPLARVHPLLAELSRAHLLTEHTPGRYTFHDLLRSYARELARDGDECGRATHRLLDHYLWTADAAARLIDRHRDSIVSGTPDPGVTPEPLAGYDRALDWYQAERLVLVAALEQAARAGFDRHCWQLAWTLFDFFDIHGYWHDMISTQQTALAAALRLGDKSGQGHAHWALARAEAKLGRADRALVHFRQTRALFEQIGNSTGLAHTHLNLGWVMDQQGRFPEALSQARRALELYQAIDDRSGQADALNAIGWYHTHLGNHEQALDYCRQSLTLHEQTGDEHGAAQAWDSLGLSYANLADHRQAVGCYLRSLELVRRLNIQHAQTIVLGHLGDAHYAAGDVGEARRAWGRAVAILDEIGHPDADTVRAKLLDLACGV